MKSRNRRILAAAAVAALSFFSGRSALAVDGIWIGTTSPSNWSTSTNWASDTIADGAASIANFSTLDIASDMTVTLDTARTVGQVLFGDTTASNNWILSGANVLTLDNTGLGTPTITVNNQTATIGSVMAGAQGLIKAGAGTLTLTSQSTFSGDTTVSSGVLNLAGPNNGTGTIRGAITVNAGATLRFSTPNATGYAAGAKINTVNINGGLLDNIGVGDNGWGVTYNLNGATMRSMSGTNATGNTQYFSFGGGTSVNVTGDTQSVIQGRINLREGNTGNAVVFTVADGAAATDLLVSAAITQSAAFGITKAGPGTMQLTFNNTFTGGTIVNAGVLELNSGNGSRPTGGGTLTINAGATVNNLVANQFGLYGSNNVIPVVINGGVLNPNQYTHMNTLTLTAGTINVESAAGGDALDFNTSNGVAPSITTLASVTTSSIASKITLRTATTFNVADGAAASDLAISGLIVGPGSMVKTGAGTLVLSNTNTYSGATTVNAGTLRINATDAITSSSLVTINGAVVTIVPGIHASMGTVTLVAGTLAADGAGDGRNYYFDGKISSTAAAAASLINAPIVELRGGGGAAPVEFSPARGTVALPSPDLSVTSNLTGTTSLLKTGRGILELSGTNTYSRGTTISGGLLRFANASALPATGLVAPADSGALAMDGPFAETFNQALNDPRLNIGGTGALALTGDNNETIDLAAKSSSLSLGAIYGATVNFTGTLTPYQGTFRLGGGGGTLNYNSASPVAGNLVVNGGGGDGAGTVVLPGPQSYTGSTTIGGGTLRVTATDALINSSSLTLNGGTLALAAGIHHTLGAFSMTGGGIAAIGAADGTNPNYFLDGNVTVRPSSETATISAPVVNLRGGLTGSTIGFNVARGTAGSGVDLSISSVLTGSTGLLKTGSGNVTLSGNNTYAGTTTFNGGTLRLDFASAVAADNVLPAASPLVLAGNTTLAMIGKAATTNTQTIGGLTLNAGYAQISATSGTSSTLNLGAITRNLGATVNFTRPATGAITTTTGNADGIIGGWATVGGTDWAVNDGSNNIIPIAAYTQTSAAAISGGTATQNWLGNGTAANSTITANTTINSLVEQNDVLINAGATLTLASGGYIMRTNNFWMQTNSGALGFLTSGLPSGELFVHVANPAQTDQAIKVIVKDNGATPVTLIKDGAGQLKLAQVNTYTGGTVVNAGTLNLTNANGTGLGGGTGIIRGALTINPGTTVVVTFHDAFGYSNAATTLSTVNINGGTLDQNAGVTNETLTGVTVNMTGGTWSTSGGGNFDMFSNGYGNTNVNTLASSSTATISASLNLRNESPIFNVASGTTASGVDLLVSGLVYGGNGLTKTGSGTMRLTNVDTYSGATTVSNGKLVLAGGANGAVGTIGSSAVTVASGAELQLGVGDATGYTSTQRLTISGTLRKLAGSFHDTLNRPVTLNGGTITSDDNGNLAANDTYNLFGNTISTSANSSNSITGPAGSRVLLRQNSTSFNYPTFDVASGSTLNINTILANYAAEADQFTKTGDGTLVLNGNNTYTGDTNVVGGTLRIGSGGTSGSLGANLNLATGTMLVHNRSDDVTVAANIQATGSGNPNGGGFTQIGPGKVTLTGYTTFGGPVTVAGSALDIAGGSNYLYGGVVVNGGTLNVSGNASIGTALTINGGNVTMPGYVYTSNAIPVIVNGGSLVLSNNSNLSGAGSFTVQSPGTIDTTALGSNGMSLGFGQVLRGNGSIIGSLATYDGAQVIPGTLGTAATLTVNGNLNLSGGTLRVDLSNNPASGNDRIVVNGDVTAFGPTTVSINLPNGSLAAGDSTYVLATYTGTGTNVASGIVVDTAFSTSRSVFSIKDNTTTSPKQIELISKYVAPSVLFWRGDQANPTYWDLNNTKNWINQNGDPFHSVAAGAHDMFYSNDNVIFDDTGLSTAVALQGGIGLTAGSVTVNSTSVTHDYTIDGGNQTLTTVTDFNKSGTSRLTLNNITLDVGGTMLVSGGVMDIPSFGNQTVSTLTVDGAQLLGNANFTITGNPATSLPPSASLKNGAEFGGVGTYSTLTAGDLTVSGGAKYTSIGNITLSGPLTLTDGAVNAGQITASAYNVVKGTISSNLNDLSPGTPTQLHKTGPDIATLSGTSSAYTGPTVIDGGVLEAQFISTGGNYSSIGASSNAASNLVLNGGTLRLIGSFNGSTDRGFTVTSAGGAIDVADSTSHLTLTSPGTDATPATPGLFVKAGAGELISTATNGLTSRVEVQAGMLTADTSSVRLFKNGATVKIDSGATVKLQTTNQLFNGTGVNAVNLTIDGGTLLMTGLGHVHDHVALLSLTNGGSVVADSGALFFPTTLGAHSVNYQIDAATVFVTGTGVNKLSAVTGIGLNTAAGVNTLFDVGKDAVLKVEGRFTNGEGDGAHNNGITKTGEGVMILADNPTPTFGTGPSTYTGPTTISGGTLRLVGGNTLSGTPRISVAAGATLDVSGVTITPYTLLTGQTLGGAGTVVGGLQLAAGSTVVPGTAGTVGTLAFAPASALSSAGSTFLIDLPSVATAPNDVFAVTGNLDFGADPAVQSFINPQKLGADFVAGTYTIGTYSGTLSNFANLAMFATAGRGWTLGNTGSSNGSITLTYNPTAAASLVWTGGTNGLWNIAGDPNWKNILTSLPDKFYGGDSVLFDNTGSPNTTVTLTQSVAPASITFGNTIATAYTIVPGNFQIVGTTGLTLNGGGTVSLGGAHTFTGPVMISGGSTLVIDTIANGGVASGLGASTNAAANLILDAGTVSYALIFGTTASTDRNITAAAGGAGIMVSSGSSLQLNGVISGTGAVTFGGGGSFILPHVNNSFTGNFTVTGAGTTVTASVLNGNLATSAFGARATGRDIIVSNGATMVWNINNVLGGGGNAATALPRIDLDGGTLQTTKYNMIPDLVLRSGANLVNSSTDPSGTYQGWQFIGTVTVAGSSPSFISNNNPVAAALGDHLRGGAVTAFDVADVTGSPAPDLIVTTPFLNGSGDYAGVGSLEKKGIGTMLFTDVNSTYTGNTTITAGTLALGGIADLSGTPRISVAAGATFDISGVSSTFTLASGKTLDGAGSVTGAFVTGSGSTLSPGGTGTTGTLTFNTGLTFAGGNIPFDMPTSIALAQDLIDVPGAVVGIVNATAATIVQPRFQTNAFGFPIISQSPVAIVKYGNTATGVANLSLDPAVVATLAGSRSQNAAIANHPNTPANSGGYISIDGLVPAATLVWSGNTGTTVDAIWKTAGGGGVANWKNGVPLDKFYQLDQVAFDDSADPGATTITVGDAVRPGLVVFNNTTGVNLTVQNDTGAGGRISGATTLLKTGTGTVTLSGDNDFTGPVILKAGTLAITSIANGGAASPIGASTNAATNVLIDGGTLRYAPVAGTAGATDRGISIGTAGGGLDAAAGSSLQLNGSLTGTGPVVLGGSGGTIILNNNNAGIGAGQTVTINAGTVQTLGSQVANRLSNNANVIINSGGTLEFTTVNSTPTGVNAIDVTVNAGGTFKTDGGAGFHSHLRNITLNGGQILGQGTGNYDNEDFQLNGNVTVGGTTPSTVTLNNGIGMKGTSTWTVNDVTGNADADLTISGVGALHNGDSAPVGGLIKAGNGTMVLATANTYTGGTTIDAGTLRTTNLNALGGPAASATVGTAGTLQIDAPGAHLGNLTVNGTAKVTAGNVVLGTVDGSGNTVTAGTLSLGAAGVLDLNDRELVIHYNPAGVNPAVMIKNALAAGRNVAPGGVADGTWDGLTGIRSTTAAQAYVAAGGTEFLALGYGDTANMPFNDAPDMQGLASTVFVKYTRVGDASLDGIVGDTDVTVLGALYDPSYDPTGPGGPKHWYEGDFNYNGIVDDSDVTLLGANYDPAQPPMFASLSSQYSSAFAAAFIKGYDSTHSGTATVVPEPGALTLLGLGALGLIRRKRRQA